LEWRAWWISLQMQAILRTPAISVGSLLAFNMYPAFFFSFFHLSKKWGTASFSFGLKKKKIIVWKAFIKFVIFPSIFLLRPCDLKAPAPADSRIFGCWLSGLYGCLMLTRLAVHLNMAGHRPYFMRRLWANSSIARYFTGII
jgi:hypothetical protein